MATDLNIFDHTNKAISEDIKNELRLQGHHLTGALEQSIQELIFEENGEIILSATAAEYLEKLEKGVPASEIKINSQSLDEMTRYVELRMGYRGSKAASIAYLILRKQAREGMPTESSKQYSRTGERVHAVQEVFEKNNDKYGSLVDDAVVNSLDEIFRSVKEGVI